MDIGVVVYVMGLVLFACMVIQNIREHYSLRPGTAVQWGAFQHGVVLSSPDLAGQTRVRHAASGLVFAVPTADLRRVVW